ncbi:Transcriptional activator CadC [Luteitalea pratensis]|uniref:Transcriptional activator CadC n=1 Tax=Luteitalea pratensis TaxID=1855912 RepID=A0A143PLC0_LUTPR|nr:tetratricopeptide repeat protein [Luteitalea pratensis]AMY09357.1 Transcriptional activator CadC [Luteitalea pratensis]
MAQWRFGVFEVDAASGELRKRGSRMALRDQPLRVLLTLLEQAGRVVSRDQLRVLLWPDQTYGDFDDGINKAISELRRTLGDSLVSPRFVETITKRGYRFICPVQCETGAGAAGTLAPVLADARLAYATGRYLWNRRTTPDLYQSIGYFEQTVELDPVSGLGDAGLADAHALLGIWGMRDPHTAFAASRQAALRALKLAPDLAEAHTAYAEVLKGYEWDWTSAERHYRRALALRPDYATAHQWYAQLLASLGRHADAIRHVERARHADPASPAITAFAPYIYLAARQYERAVQHAQRAVTLEPLAPLTHLYLGRAYLCANRHAEAVTSLRRARALGGPEGLWEAALCFAEARAGDLSAARVTVSGLVDRARHAYVSPFDLGIAFTGIGDHDAALSYLERAVQERVMRVIMLGDPEFDRLRADARYVRLLKTVQLPLPCH